MAKATNKPDTQAEETQNIDAASGASHTGNTMNADLTKNDSDELVAASAREVVSSASKAINQPQKANFTKGSIVDELNNVDFVKLIGGPLQAAIDAQVASSLATINFIKTIGLEPIQEGDTGFKQRIRMVDFSYTIPATTDVPPKPKTISIPLLAIVPIPSLRIESVDINFNAKLDSIQTEDISSDIKVAAELNAKFAKVSLKVTVASQRSSTTGFKVEKEFTLNVKVRAVQDEIPAGLEKVLSLLSAQ